MKALIGVVFLACGVIYFPVADAQVSYSVTDVSGNTWQYNYTIDNNTPINPIQEFTVFYTLGQYSNLALETSPGNWSSIVVQPDAGLPADGFFDALALDSGLPTGASVSGFSVQFSYLGQGTPASQLFNVVDPNTFETLRAGNTGPTAQAPEIDPASTISAVTLLLGALAVVRGRKSTGRMHA